jgi:hypothetical protein
VDGTAESVDPKRADQPAGRRWTHGRAPVIFAVAGVLVALIATGLFVYRQGTGPRLTPEETVDRFLAAVFVANSSEQLDGLVCGNWDVDDAMRRTTNQVGTETRISWYEIQIVTSDEHRATLSAHLGLRFQDDVRPSADQQWHFTLVNEDGWRVCEARPFRI